MIGSVNDHMRKRPAPTRPEAGSALPPSSFQMRGIPGGNTIATDKGWRPVDALAIGESVMTFDHGLQRLQAMTCVTDLVAHRYGSGRGQLINVPVGAIGNSEPLVLLPEQRISIDHHAGAMEGAAQSDDPVELVPAKTLVGLHGIESFQALRPFDVFTLHFEVDELVYLEGGALTLAQAALPAKRPARQCTGWAGQRRAPHVIYQGADAIARVDGLKIAGGSPHRPASFPPGRLPPHKEAA